MFFSKRKECSGFKIVLSYGRNYVFKIFLLLALIVSNVNFLYSENFEELFSRWEKISSGT